MHKRKMYQEKNGPATMMGGLRWCCRTKRARIVSPVLMLLSLISEPNGLSLWAGFVLTLSNWGGRAGIVLVLEEPSDIKFFRLNRMVEHFNLSIDTRGIFD